MIYVPVEPAVSEYLHAKAAKNFTPLSGSFELTPVCNMNCKMCYVRMSKSQQEQIRPLRTKDEWISIAKQAKDKGLLYLLLTGGEPFLRDDFKEILQELHRMGFIISINSNGTLIDEEVIEWLKECPPVRINITLYGSSDETYMRLCGNPRGFTQVTNAIRLLNDVGITVKLNCSLTPYNVDDLEDMISFAREHNLIIQPSSYMFPPMRKDKSFVGKNNRFTPEEAAYYSAKIKELLNGSDAFLKQINNDGLIPLQEPSDDCLDCEGDMIRCRAGKCSFWITWDGRLSPCGMFAMDEAKNVFDVGFEDAWKSASDYAMSIRLPAKCSNCGYLKDCKACAAMVYTETGSFNTVPEYRCKMAHHYPVACKQIASEILKAREQNEF